MNQIEILCQVLSKELSSMQCPDCGKRHHVMVSHLKGESPLSPSFPTLLVGPEAEATPCLKFLSKVRERVYASRRDLMRRHGLL